LKHVGKLTNAELADVFGEWNKAELDSFLIDITAKIFAKADSDVFTTSVPAVRIPEVKGQTLVDVILDKTGNKGTGKMTIKEGAEECVALGTMSAALDARFIAFDKDARQAISQAINMNMEMPKVDRTQLIDDVRNALYCSKICSYAQGMNLIRQKSSEMKWGVNLGECARIWKGGCIIKARFLGRIKTAYDRSPNLANLIIDEEFLKEILSRQMSWRRIVSLCAAVGLPIPSMMASLAYFDSYRRATLEGASLVQAQRDYFGSHTFERKDKPRGEPFHCKWTPNHAIAE